MAPSVAETVTQTLEEPTKGIAKLNLNTEETPKNREDVSTLVIAHLYHFLNDLQKGPSYPFYYPYFDVDEKFPPTEIFEFSDPGLRANPAKPNLLTAGVTTKHLSPYLGTEVKGTQISKLSKEGLDELALFVAERKVVLFRDQDFKDLTPERQIDIARHFGPIQRHPTSGNVKGYPEFHVGEELLCRSTEHALTN